MERKCSRCEVVKPLAAFPSMGRGGKKRGVCAECRRAQERGRYVPRGGSAKWTPEEDELIVDNYPHGGAALCRALLTGRSIGSIQQRAFRLGVAFGVIESADLPWPLPQQDSAPMHLLFQRTAVPVFASALVASV